MSVLKRTTYKILLLFCLFLVASITISFIVLKTSIQQPQCATVPPQFICGTKNSSEKAQEGKQFFNANCAACHKLDKKMTGPSLRGMVNNDRYPYKNFVFDYISKEDSLHNINDAYTKAINEEYSSNYKHKFKITKNEFEELMDYIKE